MSLVDSKTTVIHVAQDNLFTVEQIECFFEHRDLDVIIQRKLESKEIQDYFNYRLVGNFKEFLEERFMDKFTMWAFSEHEKKCISYLLNTQALMRDVKVNIEIKILQNTFPKFNINKVCEEISKDDFFDIIYNIEEELDYILTMLSNDSSYINGIMEQDEKDNNLVRTSVILSKEFM